MEILYARYGVIITHVYDLQTNLRPVFTIEALYANEDL